MSKLVYELNPELLAQNTKLLVPYIFTAKQLDLLQRKILKKSLNPTEIAYFSRTIIKKIKAINSFIQQDSQYFISGEESMLNVRKEKAITMLKQIEKNHKNTRILLSGSFLYNVHYNDIDVFIISKYDKEDFRKGNFHFNYLKPDVFGSLFFNSLSKLCISNFKVSFIPIKEEITLEHIISKYQEVMRNLFEKNNQWLKIDLREFIMYCNYAGNKVVLNSMQLRKTLNNILIRENKEKLIQKLFVNSVLYGFKNREMKNLSLNMVASYKSLIKEYNDKKYYATLINSFEEVLDGTS